MLCAQAVKCHVPISAGLVPVGSQLASYNKRTDLSRSPLGLPLIVLHILSSKKNSAFVGPWPKRVPREGQIMESLQSNP